MSKFDEIYRQIISESVDDTKYRSLAGYTGVVLGTNITEVIKAVSKNVNFQDLVYAYKKEAPSNEYNIIEADGSMWLLYPYVKDDENRAKVRANAINMLVSTLSEVCEDDSAYDSLKKVAASYGENPDGITSIYDVIEILIDYTSEIDVLFAYI